MRKDDSNLPIFILLIFFFLPIYLVWLGIKTIIFHIKQNIRNKQKLDASSCQIAEKQIENSNEHIIASNLNQLTPNELVDEFNNTYTNNEKYFKIKQILLSISLISFVLISASVYFIILSVACLIAVFCLPRKKYILLEYDFGKDTDISLKYTNLIESIEGLEHLDKLCEINSTTANYDIKRQAGASSLLRCKEDVEVIKNIKYVKSNIELVSLSIQNKILLFLPDFVLVLQNNNWISIGYNELKVCYNATRFIEEDKVPKDTEILDYAWQYQNHDGTRDKRYSDNRQIPVCAYGKIELTSSNGLNIIIMGSNRNNLQKFSQSLNRLIA